ncbi:MAG: AAC(3) family N-acetyltransferase [Lentisphaeria bacterium]|nr:AAC(3) family N-acetyltransferase [Lentisphaeria bacterium]
MHTRESLQQDLRKMQIFPEDTLLVHSSLKSIGEVEGRGEGVVRALMDYFANSGLLVMPVLTYDRRAADDPVFDVLNTPSIVGTLGNLFLAQPGVIRSWHPTHSVAAFGREAEAFTAGHEKFDTPAARQSPWGRLIDRKAKILFIGCSISHNTFLHGVEEQNHVPQVVTDDPEILYVITPDGRKLTVPSRRHQDNHSRFYAKMGPVFQQCGLMKDGYFGDAECHLLDAAGTAELTGNFLRQDPYLFRHDRAPETYLKIMR